jgi:hypothetical protein
MKQGREDAGIPEIACPSNYFTEKINFVLKVY